METTSAFEGLVCPETGERFDAATSHHPDGKPLDPTYDYASIRLSREQLASRPAGPGKYNELLPFPAEARAWLG
jgi:hypothetical protein